MAVVAVAGQTVSTDLGSIYGLPTPDEGPDTSLGKDAFLKLLVAQLKYQDPMKPTDSADFIATTAQFTMIEKLEEIADQGRADASISQISTASALIGKEITVTGTDGLPQSAIVERTTLVGGQIVVVTDKGQVELTQIIGIGEPGSAAKAAEEADAVSTTGESDGADADDPTDAAVVNAGVTKTEETTDSSRETNNDAAGSIAA